jgi:hypothetical protein
MRNVALDMAALNGKTITQAHTDYCQEFGHATYRLGGVVQDRCPRCDALTNETCCDIAWKNNDPHCKVCLHNGVVVADDATRYDND